MRISLAILAAIFATSACSSDEERQLLNGCLDLFVPHLEMKFGSPLPRDLSEAVTASCQCQGSSTVNRLNSEEISIVLDGYKPDKTPAMEQAFVKKVLDDEILVAKLKSIDDDCKTEVDAIIAITEGR